MVKIKKEIKEELTEFQAELRKQMANFIVGAFSFVAALVWRDAIKSFVNKLINAEVVKAMFPGNEWVVSFITAIVITLIAVVGIVVTTKVLNPKT